MPPSPTSPRRCLPGRRAAVGARHVVFFDGVCGLCDRTVRFLVAHDRDGVLHYAPLQGVTAGRVLARLGLAEPVVEAEGRQEQGGEGEAGAPATMVFVRDEGSERERAYLRSSGILATLDAVGGVWRILSWLKVIPTPLRDALYRFVARHRYRWFGKVDACQIPPPEVRARLLD